MIAPIKPDKYPLKKVFVKVTVHKDGKITHKVLKDNPLTKKKKK